MNIKFKQNNIKLAIAAGIALSTVTLSMPAYANDEIEEIKLTKSVDMTVEAHVGDTCKITTNNVEFGEYDPILSHSANALTAKGGVNLTCTNASINEITMSLGEHHGGLLGAGSTASRRMEAKNTADNFLAYEVYADEAYSTVFDASSGTPYTGVGTLETVDVFAQIFPAQTGAVRDDYEDTISVTITY